jgi:TPP-dependent 2-oxoacid decarboxylase
MATAASEIDRVLKACATHRQPVYLDLSMDAVEAVLPDLPNRGELTLASIRNFMLHPLVVPAGVTQAIDNIVETIHRAERPVIIVGRIVIRLKRVNCVRLICWPCVSI